ncbi:chaperone NapD [Kaistia granuli]|uniref:chaperone NapD n=1 Tax=Kaistia granuli TaxID=363259 RepID=UPI0003648B30|nr:chaperone NapD [Kaistia granuli]
MRTRDHDIDRRAFLTGNVLSEADKARRPAERFFHISSAVVTVRPEKAAEVARRLAALPQTEVHGIEGSKIVIVMEADSTGEIGGRLTTIALMDDVFSANLVFEQIEPLDDHGADP